MAEGMTALDLAEDLGMLQPDDIQWLLSEHLGQDLHDEVIPVEWCVELRWILQPERGTHRTGVGVLARAPGVEGRRLADSPVRATTRGCSTGERRRCGRG